MTLTKLFLIFLHVLTADKKSLLRKGLRFCIPPKKIEYADFLSQETIMFEMESKNRDFLKNKLKDICFSTLKSFSVNKVEQNLLKSETLVLNNLLNVKT